MKKTIFAILGILAGCSGVLVIDPSISALEANDYTLAISACSNVPGGGMDICHVRENTDIASNWVLVVPGNHAAILGGELDVYYRDIHRSYGIHSGSNTIEIPWRDFFRQPKWTRDLDGEALALVSIRYKDDQGLEKVVKFRGIAKIVVTKEGYDRLPIDSGFSAFKTECKIQYSTAGRSAISCR